MAKRNNINPILLVAASCLLLTAGWLMGPFPILIFLGLAPLFALTDRKDSHGTVWEKAEYILLILAISLVTYSIFHSRSVVVSLVSAIALTVAFVAHTWAAQTLGKRSGKVTILLFWLAMEYLFLKIHPDGGIFLADSLRLQPSWTRWNIHTGYLGGSLWVLLVNWILYQTFLTGGVIRWPWLLAALLLLAGPILYSLQLDSAPVTRTDMVNLYTAVPIQSDVSYLARGEFVVRTAAWISTLILLFTFVKSQTKKR
ncbi:MAG: hypothetical protein SH819_14185 [Cytophagales bacterium]|nr:hypothetical protein [Cytophagales bacterium]